MVAQGRAGGGSLAGEAHPRVLQFAGPRREIVEHSFQRAGRRVGRVGTLGLGVGGRRGRRAGRRREPGGGARKEETIPERGVEQVGGVVFRPAIRHHMRRDGVDLRVREAVADAVERLLVADVEIGVRILAERGGRGQRDFGVDRREAAVGLVAEASVGERCGAARRLQEVEPGVHAARRPRHPEPETRRGASEARPLRAGTAARAVSPEHRGQGVRVAEERVVAGRIGGASRRGDGVFADGLRRHLDRGDDQARLVDPRSRGFLRGLGDDVADVERTR